MTRQVLCYGDSNTWGCVPLEGSRIQLASRARSAGPACFRMSSGRATASSTKVSTGGRQPATMTRNRIGTAWRSCYRPSRRIIRSTSSSSCSAERLEAPFRRIAGGCRRRGREIVDAIRRSRFGPDGGEPAVLLVCPLRSGVFDGSRAISKAPSRSLDTSPRFREVADLHRCAFDAGEHVSKRHGRSASRSRRSRGIGQGAPVAAAVTTIGATPTPWLGGRSSSGSPAARLRRPRCASTPSSAWRRARRSPRCTPGPVRAGRPPACAARSVRGLRRSVRGLRRHLLAELRLDRSRRGSRASRTSTSSRRASRCCCTSRSPRSTARSA